MKERETEIPQVLAWMFTRKRLGYGLLVGLAIASLPWLFTKFNVTVLNFLFILEYPGNLAGLAIGGWNARPLTGFLCFSANLVFYTVATCRLLVWFEKRNHPRS